MNVADQRCFNVDSTLMCLLGNELISNQAMSKASAEISSAISALNLNVIEILMFMKILRIFRQNVFVF